MPDPVTPPNDEPPDPIMPYPVIFGPGTPTAPPGGTVGAPDPIIVKSPDGTNIGGNLFPIYDPGQDPGSDDPTGTTLILTTPPGTIILGPLTVIIVSPCPNGSNQQQGVLDQDQNGVWFFTPTSYWVNVPATPIFEPLPKPE